jgi:hypothetical protein
VQPPGEQLDPGAAPLGVPPGRVGEAAAGVLGGRARAREVALGGGRERRA